MALALPDGTIAPLYGQNVVMAAGTTPFAAMTTNTASPNYTAQAMAEAPSRCTVPTSTSTRHYFLQCGNIAWRTWTARPSRSPTGPESR